MVDQDTSGEGPVPTGAWKQRDYHHPAAGWGAATSVMKVLSREHAVVSGTRAMFKMNHENDGFDCPG